MISKQRVFSSLMHLLSFHNIKDLLHAFLCMKQFGLE